MKKIRILVTDSLIWETLLWTFVPFDGTLQLRRRGSISDPYRPVAGAAPLHDSLPSGKPLSCCLFLPLHPHYHCTEDKKTHSNFITISHSNDHEKTNSLHFFWKLERKFLRYKNGIHNVGRCEARSGWLPFSEKRLRVAAVQNGILGLVAGTGRGRTVVHNSWRFFCIWR